MKSKFLRQDQAPQYYFRFRLDFVWGYGTTFKESFGAYFGSRPKNCYCSYYYYNFYRMTATTIAFSISITITILAFKKSLHQKLPKTQALQKARLSYMLAYYKNCCFHSLLGYPYHACPAPARTRMKKGTTLVEDISVEAAFKITITIPMIITITITITITIPAFQKSLHQKLPQTQALQKARLSYMLAYYKNCCFHSLLGYPLPCLPRTSQDQNQN